MAALGQIDRDVEVNNNAGGGGGITILPDDDYELEIIESDVAANSKGTGQNASFKIQVASGPHKGVRFFGGINNIQHQSAQSQAIAQGELKALCLAAGVDFSTLEDTETLHYVPWWGRVGTETYFSKKHNKDMTKNVVKKYLYEGMEDDKPAAPAEKQPPKDPPKQPAEKPATVGKRPWSKG